MLNSVQNRFNFQLHCCWSLGLSCSVAAEHQWITQRPVFFYLSTPLLPRHWGTPQRNATQRRQGGGGGAGSGAEPQKSNYSKPELPTNSATDPFLRASFRASSDSST